MPHSAKVLDANSPDNPLDPWCANAAVFRVVPHEAMSGWS